jgi:hypothetical protein
MRKPLAKQQFFMTEGIAGNFLSKNRREYVHMYSVLRQKEKVSSITKMLAERCPVFTVDIWLKRLRFLLFTIC